MASRIHCVLDASHAHDQHWLWIITMANRTMCRNLQVIAEDPTWHQVP
jgi:hypothetical protein